MATDRLGGMMLRWRAVAAVLALLLPMAACAGGEDYEPSEGQVEHTATIDALDLVLVTNGRGVARLVGTLLNKADQSDRLVGLDLAAEPKGGYSVIFVDGPVTLPPGEPVRLYREARLTLLSEAFTPGFRADVTLAFADSPSITTTIPVKRNTGIYKDVEVMSPPDGDIRPEGG